ncbi:MAG: Wzz/FepE/Etk N-terminal domain-containing protein [Terriglobales bacterium]
MSSTIDRFPAEQLSALLRHRSLPLLELCWEHRRWLGKITAAGLVVALILAFIIPSQYESTARIMPPDPQSQSTMGIALLAAISGGSGGLGSAGSLASGLLGGKTQGSMFMAVLASRTVEDDIINRLDLRRVYGISKYVDTRKKLAGRTTLEEDKKTGVITITVSDRDRNRARDITREYVNELNRLVNQLSTSSARQERIFLESRLKSIKEDLDLSSQQLSQFSSKTATLDVPAQGKAMIDAAAKMQAELIAAESELRGLEQIYAPENVRVRSLKARVNELQDQVRKFRGASDDDRGVGGEGLYPSVRQLPLLGVTYFNLYRQVKIQEAVYEILTKQYELAKVQEAREIPVVKMLDQPDLAERKSFPPRVAMMILGALLALAGGIAWLAGLNLWWREHDAEA